MQATDTPTMDQMVDSLLVVPEKEEAPEVEETEIAEAESPEPQADDAEVQASAEDEAEEEQDVPDQPKTFTVKVDGREVEVTEQELLRGYSGQAYIQKGMQEVAEARKAFEAERQALQESQAKLADFVQQIQTTGFKPAPTPPDPKMAETDVVGYWQERARYDAEMQAYQAQQSQIMQMYQQRQQMTQAQQQAYLAEQARILSEKIPDFADAGKASKIKENLVRIGREAYGFTAEELSGVMDARQVQVLHDAMKWREFQESKAKAQQPKAPPSVKPNAKRPEPPQLARAKQLEAAKKSGQLGSFVDLILERK